VDIRRVPPYSSLMPISSLKGKVRPGRRAGIGMRGPLNSADPPVIGPFQLLEVLGSGGFGKVYLGRSASGQLAAVKVILPELAADPEFRVRFRREVSAARKISGRFTARV